jgi:quercetin dioxygenase-like cupin family protein
MNQPTRLDQVTPFEIGAARFYPLSGPSLGGTELAVWQLRLGPGPAGLPHTIDREEVFLCTSGELVLTVDGEEVRLAAGDVLAVPAGSHLSAGAGGGPEGAVVTVCTRAGLSAVTDDGTVIRPAWAS